MSRPDITVVVCTYNRDEMLRDALNSVLLQNTAGQFSYEVVVVDDRSTDATPQVIEEASRRSPVLVRQVQGLGQGIGAARNTGIRESSGEWIAFFDDDQVADPDWLRELFTCAVQTGAQIVGGSVNLLLSDEETRALPPVCRPLLGESNRGWRLGRYPRRTSPGCGNMLVRSALFLAVGQFDELFARGGEDTYFGMRAREAGIDAWFTPRAIVGHQVPAYRLNEGYLVWSSLRGGDNFAYRDFLEWGLARTLLVCAAKIGRAGLVSLPLMLVAYLLGNGPAVLGRKCSLARAWGYLRESLYLVSPTLFSQRAYFAHLNFRGERGAFAPGSAGCRRVLNS